jgi:hypothetical protein
MPISYGERKKVSQTLRQHFISDSSDRFRPYARKVSFFSPNDIYGSCVSMQTSLKEIQSGIEEPYVLTVPRGYIGMHYIPEHLSGAIDATQWGKPAHCSDERTLQVLGPLENQPIVSTYGVMIAPGSPDLISVSPSGSYVPQTIVFDGLIVEYIRAAADEAINHLNKKYAEYLTSLKELKELSCLSSNWDGEGAARIDGPTTTKARELLTEIYKSQPPERPSIGPMPDGRYTFTWEAGAKELWIYVSAKEYTSHQWDSASQFKSIAKSWTARDTVVELIEWLKS